MKIGIVGYQGSGKSSLFEWLTGAASDPAKAHEAQIAMAPVPDDRIEPLCEIYKPKKITTASLEFVDTPGLDRSHEGNAARLALIREAGCLVMVTAAFDGSDRLPTNGDGGPTDTLQHNTHRILLKIPVRDYDSAQAGDDLIEVTARVVHHVELACPIFAKGADKIVCRGQLGSLPAAP